MSEKVLIGPVVHRSCFVHPTALIMGDVNMGADSSAWPYCVIRGDYAPIRIGERSNVQDGAIIHVDEDHPATIGDEVTMGHGAIVHGATVGDRCIIGIRAVVLNDCTIGKGSIVGAGAVVPPGTEVPPFSLVLGIPGKVKRTDPALEQQAMTNASVYVENARMHKMGEVHVFRDL
jgi:carbonic anhydrase/acetyltransferase-like protein (isoleucine patch superfamily)